MKIIKLAAPALAILILFCACAPSALQSVSPSSYADISPEIKATQTPSETPAVSQSPEPAPEPVIIRLTAAGDNLLHTGVSRFAEQSDGTYDYSPIYTNIKPLIEGSDIAYINQESMLTGAVSGYPNFSGPPEVADALLDAGFNVINLANNHSMDKGSKGLLRCLENVHSRPFDAVIGAYASGDKAEETILVEKKGITFGFLSYTYGLNGYSLPSDMPWLVSLIDEEKILEDITRVRPDCDYLIVSLHWGNEYELKPNNTQRELAQLLCDAGVDLIIGTHPHVLQAMEWLDGANGNRTLCAYSLGNFVSSQDKSATMLGGILEVELSFDPATMEYETVSSGVIPVVTHYTGKKHTFSIYPLSSYSSELAAQHGIVNYNTRKPLTLEYLQNLAVQTLGDAAIDIPYEG